MHRWPDAWRPERLFGLNRNYILHQRLQGETHLDEFEVTHAERSQTARPSRRSNRFLDERPPPGFDRITYRRRKQIERFFNKLKHFRAIATRYEKHAANHLALVKLVAIRIWLRTYASVS